MANCILRQRDEKNASNMIDLMVWSNRLDLLAISNFKGEVQIHRLSWQKVWNFPCPKEDCTVKAMAWRPDGKALAIGYNHDCIYLINIEDKEYNVCIDKGFQGCKGGVTFLTWVTKSGPSPNMSEYNIYDDSYIFTPRLRPTYKNYQNKNNDEDNNHHLCEIQEQLNLLICGFGNGHIHMSVFGKYPFCTLNLQEILNDEYGDYEILNIELTDDFSVMQVYYLDKPSQNIYGATLNTSVLSSYSEEIFIVANRYVQIEQLLKRVTETMGSITEASENIILEMDSKMAKYALTVPDGGVSADFLELLMMGTVSPELDIFLSQDLTTKILKKFGNSIEQSYSTIQKLVLKQLNVTAQSVTYHLAELRGLSRIPDRYKILGLKEQLVTNAIKSSYAFLNKCLEMQQVIDVSMRSYKAFFRWLFGVLVRFEEEQGINEVAKITQQDLSHIAEFLYNFGSGKRDLNDHNTSNKPVRFNLEKLSQYLQDSELSILSDNEDNQWQKFLKDNPCLFKESDTLFSVSQYKKFSLVQQQYNLMRTVAKVFKEGGKDIGKHFSVMYNFNFYEMKTTEDALHKFRLSQIYDSDIGAFMTCFLNNNMNRDGFCFLSININSKNNESTAIKFNADNIVDNTEEESWEIMDVQFYSTEYISVLVKHAHKPDCSVFIHLSIRSALDNSLGHNMKSKQCIFNDKIPKVDVSQLLEGGGCYRIMDKIEGYRLAVSGGRKVAVILAESKRKVRIFEIVDAEEEEEDDDDKSQGTPPPAEPRDDVQVTPKTD